MRRKVIAAAITAAGTLAIIVALAILVAIIIATSAKPPDAKPPCLAPPGEQHEVRWQPDDQTAPAMRTRTIPRSGHDTIPALRPKPTGS